MFMNEGGKFGAPDCESIIKEVKEIKEVEEVKERTQGSGVAQSAMEKLCYDANRRILLMR
jgi:hypothetical protein